MRVSLVLSALLCFTTWMSMGHATHGPVADCCIGWSNTRVQLDRIANYTVQSEGICPNKAIIFHTKFGKTLCSDPSSPWAKRAIKKVDEEKKKKGLQEMGLNEDRATSEITPAVSTTSKKAPQKKGRNGRRRLRKRSRKGKKLLSKRI
ncbi:LOW QUALITY PROTEIN: eotaxin-like [Dicentrarchus labrax]|uniref:LOW QUALITY PROTEIN: eotaxin-like n=1 Tax=Dicentrarchus labrax TaxID=13489 RepID=UPI0021F647F3|nr:LOW QUALITY PROTEIN: eotaxin-like [Dicentrarchus labrax]